MGERTRRYDWGNSPLGLPSQWPVALRTLISTLLNSKAPMLLLWGNKHIQFYNDAFCRYLGSAGGSGTAIGQPADEFWAGSWSHFEPWLREARTKGEAEWSEVSTSPFTGKPVESDGRCVFSCSAVVTEGEGVDGILCTCVEYRNDSDTSAGTSLPEPFAKFRYVADNSPAGLWLSDPQGELTYVNRMLCEWTGFSFGELLGSGWINALVEEDRPAAMDAFVRAVSGKTHYDVEFRIQRKDGSRYWCRAAGNPFYTSAGRYGGYAGFCMDIQRLKEVNERIFESRLRVLNSFEQSPVGIALLEKEGLRFSMANRFYCNLVGRSSEQLLNHRLLDALPEIAGQGFDQLIENVIATGRTYQSREVAVDLMRNNRTETLYVDMVYQPQFDEKNEATAVLVVATDVTEQVLARRGLEESALKFRNLVEEAPVATCLFVGRNMTVEIANELMLGYWGKDRSVIGRPLNEALPELEDQPFLAILDEVYRTGEAYTAHNAPAKLMVNGTLGTYYFDYTYKPLRNLQGEVYAVMNMAVDVTEQVLARQGLEESERFARHIFYNSPVAKIVYVGPNMVLREANEAMMTILNRDESILNRPILESIPELKYTGLEKKYRRVMESGESIFEYAQPLELIRNGETSVGYFDYIYKALRNANDEIYGVMCTVVDVTKEVATRQQIEAAEESLRNAVELANLATWTVDVIGRKVEYSPRLQQWLGVDAAEFDNGPSPFVHPRDQARVASAVANALNPAGSGIFDEVYSIVHRVTGQERIIHSSGRATFDDKGRAVRLAGTAQDVTLQQELQKALEIEVQQRTEQLAAINEELEMSNEELRRSNEELSQYAYVASHDLQEPLRKIRMFSGMLGDTAELSPVNASRLNKINSSAERMTLLIKDLLEFSRLLNSDNLRKPVDLNQVVAEIMSDFELMIAEKQAVVEIGQLPVVEAVPLQMNQLFYNLVGNSLKFTQVGLAPAISILSQPIALEEAERFIRKPRPEWQYHRISVRDNGIGFEQKYAEQIFEVFKRLHTREVYSGSGIGLALCRRIVSNHNGYLYAESTPGEGTVFHIIIPS